MENAKQIIHHMHMYQQKHNIKKHCITNSQYLRDCLIASGLKAKVKAVYATGFTHKRKLVIVMGHLIVEVEGDILEPSYEIAKLDDISYYDNIKDFKRDWGINDEGLIKKMIQEHITFCSLATTINNNEIIVSNTDFYNNQADYIDMNYF